MEQNANMPRGGEQNLFCQNIKKEIDTNDSYGENQDPIAITDQDRMANMRIRVKEEIDIKEEDLSEEETGRAELQHTSSGNDPHSRRSTSPLDNSISHRSQHAEKKISGHDKRNSSELSMFKHKPNSNVYEETSEVTIKNMNSHVNDEKYACGTCDERYSGVCDLKNHIKVVHLGVSDYKCTQCDKIFFQPYKLEKHTCYENFKTYECHVCYRQFSNAGLLKLHSVVHFEKKYVCNDCNEKFSRLCELKIHINTKHGKKGSGMTSKKLSSQKNDKIYACGDCGMGFLWISYVKEHIKMVHSGIGDYKCVVCEKKFSEACDLKEHILEMHKNVRKDTCENFKTLTCEVCNKQFSHRAYLKRRSVVRNERKFVCDDCSRSSADYYELQDHITAVNSDKNSVSNNNKIYACGYCDQKFEFCNINNHINTVHYEEKLKRTIQNNLEKLNIRSKVEKFVIQSKNKKYSFNCSQCNKTFSRPSHLKRHTCSKTYECQVCNRVFTHPGYLKQHSIVHFKVDDFKNTQRNETLCHSSKRKKQSKTYECKVCNKKFSHAVNLTRHSLVHKEKKFACDDCDKRFFNFSELSNHIKCIHCDKGSEITSKVVNICNNDKVYACDNCDERFSWLVDIKNHIRVKHLGIARFKCALCSKTFSFSQYFRLRKHVNLKHKIRESNFLEKDKKYACADCDKGYTDFRDLKSHIEAIHLGMSEYKCVQCNKTFSRFSEFKRHYNSNGHKNFEKFVCDHCDKKFSHLSLLKNHMAVHNRIQKFVCDVCGKGFFIISMLKIHMNLSHIKSRDYQCEQCGKTFVKKFQLEQHTNGVHKKLRDFQCQICDKKFQASHHLRNHVICVHEKVKNFVCDLCGNRFLLAHHLRNHVNAVHQGIKCKVYPKLFWQGSPFSD